MKDAFFSGFLFYVVVLSFEPNPGCEESAHNAHHGRSFIPKENVGIKDDDLEPSSW
jgi:hypothetical protein